MAPSETPVRMNGHMLRASAIGAPTMMTRSAPTTQQPV
jgi:hypothetical protein